MAHVVVVHVRALGGPTPHTSPVYVSLDVAVEQLARVKHFQREAPGDVTDLGWLSVHGASIVSASVMPAAWVVPAAA